MPHPSREVYSHGHHDSESVDFAHQAVEQGLSDLAELAELAEGWRRWGELADAWFAVLHGEILCRR